MPFRKISGCCGGKTSRAKETVDTAIRQTLRVLSYFVYGSTTLLPRPASGIFHVYADDFVPLKIPYLTLYANKGLGDSLQKKVT